MFSWLKFADIDKLIDILAVDRYQGVNFQEVYDLRTIKEGNTIEFRTPNGTFSPVIWQNNVNLLIKLLNYVSSSRYDDDIVSKRMKLNGKKYYNNLELYRETFLDQALELCDMVFDNNLDKGYFLRQYLKNFQVYADDEEIKAKRFIKK